MYFFFETIRPSATVTWLVVSIVTFVFCISDPFQFSQENYFAQTTIVALSSLFMMGCSIVFVGRLQRESHHAKLYELLDEILFRSNSFEYVEADQFHVSVTDEGECYWVEVTLLKSLEAYVFCVGPAATQAFTKVVAELHIGQMLNGSSETPESDLSKGIEDERFQMRRLISSLEHYLMTRPQT